MTSFPSAPLRITLLTDGLYPFVLGGIQRHSRLLSENLAREGVVLSVYHTVAPATTAKVDARPPEPTEGPWQSIRVRFVRYPRPGRYPGHYVRDSWRYSEALLEAFHRDRVPTDFIYAQGLTGLAFVAARKRGALLTPVGINAHGYEMFQTPASFRSRFEQIMLRPVFSKLTRDADAVFTFSGHIHDIVRNRLGVPESRICVIPNGIDASWIVPSPTPCRMPRRFVFIGRHDRRKGLPELLAAVRTIPVNFAQFHIVGPIPIAVLTRAPNVIAHGSITDSELLQRILDDVDVLLCPSHSEGMPTVILEGMARGLAIIATDVGAVRSMVGSDNGIVLARPTPKAIAEAITRIAHLKDEDLMSKKRSSLNRVSAYEWRHVARQTIIEIHRRLNELNRSGHA